MRNIFITFRIWIFWEGDVCFVHGILAYTECRELQEIFSEVNILLPTANTRVFKRTLKIQYVRDSDAEGQLSLYIGK
jgi:hypothetical protein